MAATLIIVRGELYRPIAWHLNEFFVGSPTLKCRDYIT